MSNFVSFFHKIQGVQFFMKAGFIFLIVFFSVNFNFAQSPIAFKNSFTEQTTDHQKFEIYLDSIDKYLYRDGQITQLAITECEKIIDKKVSLPDSSLFKLIIHKIYFKFSNAELLGAYQIISKNENKLNSIHITDAQKALFRYLKSFTYMAIGDLEAAQKAYYKNLERAKIEKDTLIISNTLYSIGQLYYIEKDFDEAVRALEESLKYAKFINILPSDLILTYKELSKAKFALKEYDEAMKIMEAAYELAKKNKLKLLKHEVLIWKGHFCIETGELKKARNIYEQIRLANQKKPNQSIIELNKNFLAALYKAEKKYQLSLITYQSLLEKIDTAKKEVILELYSNIHEINNKIQDHKAAYNNLLVYNDLKNKRDSDVKKQKTDYLKIKFEAGEKEKANAILNLQVLESKAKSNMLFVFLGFAGLVVTLLLSAFYQKVKYSKNLELEVAKRTVSLTQSNSLLNQSNKELKEFNRILSHDLKEPIRSIVGFSQLVSRPNTEKEKLNEYLSFVISGGQQLQYLINSISTYQKIDGINFCEFELIDFQKILYKSLKEIQNNFLDKTIDLTLNSTSSLYTVLDPFESILKIILNNSAKFNEHQLVKIQVDYSKTEDQHLIKFKDNGIGINIEYHDKVFEMFQRLNNREDYNGAGLGLSIAQKLVERLHGSLSIAASNPQEGTVFLLILPIESPTEIDHSKYIKENLTSTLS